MLTQGYKKNNHFRLMKVVISIIVSVVLMFPLQYVLYAILLSLYCVVYEFIILMFLVKIIR